MSKELGKILLGNAKVTKDEVARRLSKNERRLFYLLPKDGNHVTTTQLVQEFYAGTGVPTNGRVIVMGLVRAVQKKLVAMNAHDFVVHASERAGPRPIEVWLEQPAPPEEAMLSTAAE